MKIYKYEISTGVWSNPVSIRYILSLKLDESTGVWWEGICPNNKEPSDCNHVISIKKYKLKYPVSYLFNLISIVESIIIALLLIIIIFSGYHNFFKTSSKDINSYTPESIAQINSLNENITNDLLSSFYEKSDGKELEILPDFKLAIKNIENQNVLEASFSYSKNPNYEGLITDYCSGCYLYSESKSAVAMLSASRSSINKFLYDYLESSSSVYIKLMGFTDSNPVRGVLSYNGEYGDFPLKVGSSNITSYIVDGEPNKLILSQGHQIGNKELGFLRAFSIVEYIENYIPSLALKEPKYGLYSFTTEGKELTGPEFRKVKYVVEIFNPNQLIEEDNSSEDHNNRDWVFGILSSVFSLFLMRHTNSHYDKFQERKRQKKDYSQDRKGFLWFFLFSTIFIVISFYLLF
jgi:hypothetical protein